MHPEGPHCDWLSRRSFLRGIATTTAVIATSSQLSGALEGQLTNLHSFKPGKLWLDTNGKPIQAHGGSILRVNGIYYWYGENKEFTTGDTDVWTWGIRCYSSQDLYNWKDLGLIIPPNQENKNSPLHPTAMLDRPHILYNAKSRKFVCWVKLMGPGDAQTRTVLTADSILGPYKIVRQGTLPLGMNAGDYDLVISPSDGKAYMYFERVHSEMICADLTSDYTDFTGYYSTHFPHTTPPFVREGPAYFYRKGKHYLVSSGTTGYFPNPSEVAVADTYHGPFTVLGDLHPKDRSRTSFNSQISCVFKHPDKKDLYIALADRWMGPRTGNYFESGDESRFVQNTFRKAFGKDEPLSQLEQDFFKINSKVNTSVSQYVWLPIRFEEERPFIEWRTEWCLNEFE